MQLLDEVRSTCRSIAETARYVSIELDAWREPPPVDAGASSPEHPDQVLQLDASRVTVTLEQKARGGITITATA